MWKATSGSLALRSELSLCALQIPFRNGHPALGYTTRLAFSRGRTSTCKSMKLHGTHKKGEGSPRLFSIHDACNLQTAGQSVRLLVVHHFEIGVLDLLPLVSARLFLLLLLAFRRLTGCRTACLLSASRFIHFR